MRVWLITVGEPLPTDPGDVRLLRTGILAELMAARGHEVTWWNSTFDHSQKRQRANRDVRQSLRERLTIRLLHAAGYAKNISLGRVLNHQETARKFRRASASESPPEIIVCSFPTPELCGEATRYAARHGIPVVVDIRDLWPDVFLDLIPPSLRMLGRILLVPLKASIRKSCTRATAITGVTDSFVRWGLRLVGRRPGRWDRAFPLAYPDLSPPEPHIERSRHFWHSLGVDGDSKGLRVCFFGAISQWFELETVIEAARELKKSQVPCKFIICGSGDRVEAYKRMSSGLEEQFLFPGWVGFPEIWTLMRLSSVGLAPYRKAVGFYGHIPNKVVEYLSAGLPVLSSLEGELEGILDRERCGLTYRAKDSSQLVHHLVRLKEHPKELETMARNAGNLYRREFTAQSVYGRMIDYLEELSAESCPSAARHRKQVGQPSGHSD